MGLPSGQKPVLRPSGTEPETGAMLPQVSVRCLAISLAPCLNINSELYDQGFPGTAFMVTTSWASMGGAQATHVAAIKPIRSALFTAHLHLYHSFAHILDR